VSEIPAVVAAELARLRAENERLLRLLKLSPQQAAPPRAAQTGYFEAPPGLVHDGSPPEAKVAFFGALFAARTDVYAIRFDNRRTGKAGWVPAVRGGWRKGIRHAERDYLPMTADVLAAHLKGQAHVGLYPLLDGDRCWWLAADFDGPEAMFDALMYVKAGRALQAPVALEVSRPGVGSHAWVFFTAPVPAEAARRLGSGLLREAMALCGRMNLASYDRLFPSQDLLPAGGVGNLIAAPLFKPARVVQYAGRILRSCDGKSTAEVHDYHDELTGVLSAALAKCAPGYTSLGFPDPRRLPPTPSASTADPARIS
jgi:hypothetical protein